MAPKKKISHGTDPTVAALHELQLTFVEQITELKGVITPLIDAHTDLKDKLTGQAAEIQVIRENQIRFRQTAKFAGIIITVAMGAVASDLLSIIQRGLSQ